MGSPQCGWMVPKRAKAPVKTSYLGRILVLRCWILGCFFLASYSELAESWPIPHRRWAAGWAAGWAASFRKRTTAREHQAPWAIQGHLAWSEVLHKGQPDCEGWPQAGQGMAEAWERQGEVGRNNVMFEPNGEIQTGRDCPSSSPVVPPRRILLTWAGRVATPSHDDSHLPRSWRLVQMTLCVSCCPVSVWSRVLGISRGSSARVPRIR